jgi:archaeal flagellar protein FlaJ
MVEEKKTQSKSKFEEKMYCSFLPLTSKIVMPEFEYKLQQADIPDELDYYLSKYLFFAVFATLLLLFFGLFFLVLTNNLESVFTLFFISIIVLFGVILFAILKPYIDVTTKVESIKNNLSLSILSMSSIAESGAPPEAMFHTANISSETPYVNKEFGKIMHYINNLGLSLFEAINHVSEKTPSLELKKFLRELKSNIQAGGSISDFMKKKADHAQFVYHLMLDKMNKKAETFGDIYSAVVIAGPLFLFSTVMLLGMIGGTAIGGMSIKALLLIGIFLAIPVVNIIFLILLQIIS